MEQRQARIREEFEESQAAWREHQALPPFPPLMLIHAAANCALPPLRLCAPSNDCFLPCISHLLSELTITYTATTTYSYSLLFTLWLKYFKVNYYFQSPTRCKLASALFFLRLPIPATFFTDPSRSPSNRFQDICIWATTPHTASAFIRRQRFFFGSYTSCDRVFLFCPPSHNAKQIT